MTEHVTCIRDRRDPYRVLVEKLGRKENLEDLDADEKTTLNLLFKKSPLYSLGCIDLA